MRLITSSFFSFLRREVVEQELSKVLPTALLCGSFCFEWSGGAFHGAVYLVDAKNIFDYGSGMQLNHLLVV